MVLFEKVVIIKYMHLSKGLSSKIHDSSIPRLKNSVSAYHKMGQYIDLSSNPDVQMKTLAVTHKKDVLNAQENNLVKTRNPSQLKQLAQIAPSNKIYNCRNPAKQGQQMNKSTFIKISSSRQQEPSQELFLNKLAQFRPQSTNPEKNLLNAQMQRTSKQKMVSEYRPGSSKSSRLFRKKTVLMEDRLQSQNDDMEDIFIKVTRDGENERMPKVRERQRIGTSMSKKMRVMDKFQSKLDPSFFNLFAS